MLLEFITAHREVLIARTRAAVVKRLAPKPTEKELMSGVPLFLDQFVETLRSASASQSQTMDRSAKLHGAALLELGYTVSQVVHDYGDICQAITELAEEVHAPITTEEFHILNECLDNAIAESVTEYTRLRDESVAAGETERSGVLAHELRNRLSAAQLGFQAIQSGRAPTNGSVGALVTRSLHGMTEIINRAMVEVRLDSGTIRKERIRMSQLIEDAGVDGTMEAVAHGVSLTVTPLAVPGDVNVDPQILAGAIANLLQNAFKYTPKGGHVSLRATVARGRVEIDVADECGGLPPGKAEELFGAFQQRGTDRSGLGLGLFISRKGVDACGGELRVRDRPRIGCIFTIDLPLMAPAS